jgi:hypothetical protein
MLSSGPEVIESSDGDRGDSAIGVAKPQTGLRCDFANLEKPDRSGRPCQQAGGSFGGRHDAKLEILAVVECVLQR